MKFGRPTFAAALVALAAAPNATAGGDLFAAELPERYALRADKVLVCGLEGESYINDGVVIVADGLIESVSRAGDVELDDTPLFDVGERWLMPGMIDLHSHIGGTFDINGAVYQSNSGLRVNTAVVPGNRQLRRALAAGVTTVLFIPGSATNVGGQGILIKTAPGDYDDIVVRDPGSLKVAQADNPKRWGYGMNRIMLNWTIREVMRRGVAYAERWEAFEAGAGERPLVDPQFEVFRSLVAGEAQISAHTQVAQVVAASIQIMAIEAGLPLFIDHGSFDGFKVTSMAIEAQVPAILGPRNFSSENKGRGIDHDGRILGIAAEYQQRGHPQVGFNTDAPVIPAEELPLQAGMAARFGFDDTGLGTVRGLTVVPALTAGIEDRVGSLAPGLEADIVVISGPPSDPRAWVEHVIVEGRLAYDAQRDGRLF